MSFILILDADFNIPGPNVDIVAAAPDLGHLLPITSYDPTDKFTIARRAPLTVVRTHPITNRKSGTVDAATIYQT